ncbi:hypothetical protein DM01DRAFT_1338504 [Hesseltinella vesiculosa]|uniref:C2H2-type domain-containing protein n=1 Tax=Hesseltinella vesiculosa TaxID=101127 RepID=A0A1X2GA23_9FUNG|nr:hypothetical protein DM01DRAFT_1338504 [Hesseltinella vesiculosa]
MSIIQKICPFCTEFTTFTTHQMARLHIFNKHSILLPTNNCRTKLESIILVTQKIRHFSCPCCEYCTTSKDELKLHVEEHGFKVPTLDNGSCWILQTTNVTAKFHGYFSSCLSSFKNNMDVDRYFNNLLCISSVLVLQKRAKYESVPAEYFPPSLLANLHREILKSLSLPSFLDPDLFMTIKGILHMYHENQISNLATRQRLINLAMTKDGPEQSVVVAVESLLPAMKDLDAGEIGESELACSIVHPLIQSLLAYEMEEKTAKCTNTIPENGTDVGRRPDYEVAVYEQYQLSFRTCFGELKGEGSSDVSAIMDFYRLGVFAKLEIVASNLTGVLCFQALGTTITFYTLTLPHPTLYTFTEITTVTIPKTKNDIMSLICALDDLFKIATYHRTISKASEANTQLATLPFAFVQGKRKSLPVKRRPSLGSISNRKL